ncbi:MAG TPA: hypothetical protein VN774_04300 [Candidatus Limnocylindrales bacterium]|nr:hypothetical protein [Candidatus Limnocylindrales bacterium]
MTTVSAILSVASAADRAETVHQNSQKFEVLGYLSAAVKISSKFNPLREIPGF